MSESRKTKTVSESRLEITSLMRPQHANFVGNVHGGVILGMMDEGAYLCASRYAESYCVTAALDHVDFASAIRVGDMVTIRASVNAVGRTSMQVGLQVVAEDPQDPGTSRRTNRSFFTMVAVSEDGNPLPVPSLVCETEEDRKWRCEADLRRELRAGFNEELAQGRCRIDSEDAA
ncbi:MAG: acyl-CoA thioesterase [Gemmatimonadota bacterium]|nr:MAG: acyl-CoA thioesterase [Gemmatimonadota bacterium]